jgi:OOP family OmpA-OmpF porin
VAIEGHTDSIGTVEYNQRLSEDRAHSVAAQLVREGISRGRMSTRGFGEAKPIASNKTEAGRTRNRRVEVIIENR